MVQPLDQSSRAPISSFEFKTWQKVAFVISGLVSIALIGAAIGLSRNALPQTVFYAAGGGLGVVTLFVFFVVKCVKKPQNTAPSQPANSLSSQKIEPTFSLFTSKEKDLTAEIEGLKKEVFEWIETLDLPDETIEKNAHGYSDKYGWNFPYTKKELREDFELTASKKRSQKEILCHLRKMQEALPYHLGLKKDSFSSFPTKGFPNVGGNSCFFNAALQAVVHSRCVDYALLRPFFRAPDPLGPDPGSPGTAAPIPQSYPPHPGYNHNNWEELNKKYHEECEQIQKKNEEKRNTFYNHLWKKEEWDRNKERGLKMTMNFEKQFHALNSGHPSQVQLLQFVEKLRGGTSLTSAELTTFLTDHGVTIGQKGLTYFLTSIINEFVPSNYHLTITGYAAEQTEKLLSCPYTPIIILNGQGHFKVYVRTKDEDAYHVEVNDTAVIKRDRSSKSFLEDSSYRIWQPQFLSLAWHK